MNDDPHQGFPLTVESLGTVAGHLSDVLEEFQDWGLKIHEASRLPRIVDLLRNTVDSGEYPKETADLLRIGAAIQTAQEFIEIGNTLPVEPIKVVVDDLRIALGGTPFVWRPKKKGHLQRQSQLWVGAMMVQAGAPTGVLERPTGKNPDFELNNGAMRYAVEVKRPESENGAAELLKSAATQIRSGRYHGGSIVVDLTDCIKESTLCVVSNGPPDSGRINERLVALVRGLHDHIFDDSASSIRPARRHVFSLVAFARHQYWDKDDLQVPYLGRAVLTLEYQKGGPNTLTARRAKWLGKLVHDGIGESGHQAVGEVDVSGLSL